MKKNQELLRALTETKLKQAQREASSPTTKNSLDKPGTIKGSFESSGGGFHSNQEETQDRIEEDEEIEIKRESRVSKRLSDLTTIRVITIVLLILLIVPLFSYDYYVDQPEGFEYNLKYLKENYERNQLNIIELDDYCADYIKVFTSQASPLIYLETAIRTKNCAKFQSVGLDSLRTDEKLITAASDEFIAILNIQDRTQLSAFLSIGRTLYVCVILLLGAWLITKDSNELLLRPIERMIDLVNSLAREPLKVKDKKISKGEKMETKVLENALIKIASLLALGFGEAGSEIIASIIMKNSKDMDELIPGKRKCAVYGFCAIRNFTDATEVLQE